MEIRIQPREIDVPQDDPFENNLLGRKESVEFLTHLVGKLRRSLRPGGRCRLGHR